MLKGGIFHRTGYKQIAWKASKYKDEYVETFMVWMKFIELIICISMR